MRSTNSKTKSIELLTLSLDRNISTKEEHFHLDCFTCISFINTYQYHLMQVSSKFIDLGTETTQIPIGAFLHVRAEDTAREFISTNIENILLLNPINIIKLLFLQTFGLPITIFDISISNYSDRSDSVLLGVISQLKITNKIIVSSLNRVNFAVVLNEILRQNQSSIHSFLSIAKVVDTLD